jgi:hypothetical protein
MTDADNAHTFSKGNLGLYGTGKELFSFEEVYKDDYKKSTVLVTQAKKVSPNEDAETTELERGITSIGELFAPIVGKKRSAVDSDMAAYWAETEKKVKTQETQNLAKAMMETEENELKDKDSDDDI